MTRDKFYSKLREVVTAGAYLFGDFNAIVGSSLHNTDSDFGAEHCDTIDPWSLKGDLVPNLNGWVLLDIVSENNLRHVDSLRLSRLQAMGLEASSLWHTRGSRPYICTSFAYAVCILVLC